MFGEGFLRKGARKDKAWLKINRLYYITAYMRRQGHVITEAGVAWVSRRAKGQEMRIEAGNM